MHASTLIPYQPSKIKLNTHNISTYRLEILSQKSVSAFLRSKEDYILENKQLAPTTLPTFTQKIGTTNYEVNTYFSKTSKETFSDKIARLIKNDIEKVSVTHN